MGNTGHVNYGLQFTTQLIIYGHPHNIINSPYRGLTRNLAKTTAASPFMYIFLATNLRQGIDGDIEIMLLMIVQNMSCFKRLLMFDLKFI